MSGRGRAAVVAIVISLVVVTGAALAAPVAVLTIRGDAMEIVAPLDQGEGLTYSYRQSIYDVPVYEEFVRDANTLAMRGVRSPDIRSIEYFRWDGAIVRDEHGLWREDAPPPTAHRELVIRIATAGQQRFSTARWSYELLPLFGDGVVTVRLDQRPFAIAWLQSPR